MAVFTDTDVANLALQKLGQPHIDDINENSVNARTIRRAFKMSKLKVLRKHDWNFAIRRASIAADANQTEWGELNRYLLPANYVRLLRTKELPGNLSANSSTGSAGLGEERKDWQIEAGEDGEGVFIVTADGSPLEFRYIADVPMAFADELFVIAMADDLAVQTVEEITGSNTKKAELKDDAKTSLNDGKNMNSFENAPEDPAADDWLIARL